MNFKLKDKVKLIDNDKVLLQKLLGYHNVHSNRADWLTEDLYHELCHQAHLFELDEGGSHYFDGPDDGELHNVDYVPEFVHLSDEERAKYHWDQRRSNLLGAFMANTFGWNVLCSTLEALKKEKNEGEA